TPSPICNPSYNTIICAIYPETTDYYFFVTDAESKLLPAKTLAEHNANIAKVKAEKEAAAAAAGG
ncbi:MAG: endolytic transglycosylase MltG, partial [Clostridia bacterium]|nr:endolytic transglycosylase MltG [Clostridia bacterium]